MAALAYFKYNNIVLILRGPAAAIRTVQRKICSKWGCPKTQSKRGFASDGGLLIDRLDVLDLVDAAKAAMRAGDREFLGDTLGALEPDRLVATPADHAVGRTARRH